MQRSRPPAAFGRVALSGALLVALAGCTGGFAGRGVPTHEAGAGASVPQLGEAASDDAPATSVTALGPGDVFEVRVFEEQGLSGVFRVGTDGHIDYPLCGRVRVADLDASGAGAAIADCLRDGYLRSPQVSVFVQEHHSRQVYVFGQVSKPGTFPYRDGMTIVEAITRAEGFTKVAARNQVVITRVVDGREQRLRVPVEDIGVGRAPNFVLQPGDIVFVPESFF
jgi:protein involved in polysaccharide export with SLBB domain